jgi:hypothetical protein
MTSPTPPQWAEATLRLVLGPDFVSVSGNLLDEYRDSIHPTRGQGGADRWYVRQVLGFVSRRASWWAALFGGAFIIREALDWFLPPVDFLSRSRVSTAIGAGLLLTAGFWFAWRARSLAAGTFAGAVIGLLAGTISIVGSAALLAVWHDPQTLAAIHDSGGLGEVFTLPAYMVVPGVVLGTIGGATGSIMRRLSG